MGAILSYVHAWMDSALGWFKLVQNREVGWLTVNRKNGKYMREKQPLAKKIKLLILFNPVLEWIDNTKAMRFWLHERADRAGKKESSSKSKKQIKSFVDFYGIDMRLFEPEELDEYKTFQDFFIRRHKPGVRPLHAPHDPTQATTVADSRLVVYPTLPAARRIWIKGTHFSISTLMTPPTPPNTLTEKQPLTQQPSPEIWHDAAIASFRLSPQDYHRYHSPVEGKVVWYTQIKGDYYGVDPLCIRSDIDVLTRNARCVVVIESEVFGMVLFVAIGAREVGTVKIHEQYQTPGANVGKGDELGFFEFGGSSIVVAFEKGRIVFDQDLVVHSESAVEVDVEVGMSLGRAINKEEAEALRGHSGAEG